MAKITEERKWLMVKRAMAKQFLTIMGWRIPIRDVKEDPNGETAVAYTTAEPAIYISKENTISKGLDDSKQRAVSFGLFTHEMSHQKFTSFDYENEIAKDLEPWEVRMFHTICNIVEDPAIENFTPTYVGGYLLNALKYTIMRTYELAPNIETSGSPLGEYINALIQFGDIGPVKGHFTSVQAQTTFFKTLPIMLKAIENGNPKERIDMSLEIFNLSRPLWEEEAKTSYDAFEKMLKELTESLGKGVSTSASGSGSIVDDEEVEDSKDLSTGALRKSTFKKLSEIMKEKDEEKKEKDSSKKPTKTSKKSVSEETTAEGEASGSVTSSESSSSSSSGESGEDGAETGMAGGSDSDTIVWDDTKDIDLSTGEDYDPEEDEITQDGLDFFDDLVKSELEIDADDLSAPTTEAPPEFPEVSKRYTSREYRCANLAVTVSNPEESKIYYNDIVHDNKGKITGCYKKLEKLFAEDAELKEYRSSGKLSLTRLTSGTVTSKVYTRKVDPANKSDLSVCIAVDESGSMSSGGRMERAKAAAIDLVEIFSQLHVPTYVLGFSADIHNADAVHYHYINWKSNAADRMKIASMSAKANNFDGYSIRYASKLLSKRDEAHKILIVISDGQPAASAYNGIDGYSDTKDSIREARNKYGEDVLGVAIGADADILQQMYGKDFIFVKTSDDLFSGIMKKFTDIVSKWD